MIKKMIIQHMIGLFIGWMAIMIQGQTTYTFSPNRLGSFNHFVKTPQNSELIQTGGRLIERHLGYLYEAGFASVLSISEFTTNDTIYNDVPGNYPSSEYEMSIVRGYGLEGQYLASSLTADSARTISDIITNAKKPLYIHCHVGYTANLFLQLHFYLTQQINAEQIYSNSLLIGYDYQNNTDVVNLINSLTGRSDVTAPQKIELTLTLGEQSYKNYYWPHRLGESDNWYNAGQILSTQITALVNAGYKTVISFRDNGEATARLPNETTSGSFIPNYEFSDAVGNYDVKSEQLAIESNGIQFQHLPLVSSAAITWTKEEFDLYLPALQEAEKNGPVLAHCASGYRSSAFVLTYLAYSQKFCSDWVFSQAVDVGFHFVNDAPSATDAQVVNFVKEVLGC